MIDGEEPFAMAELILSSFMRIVTHPKVLKKPASLKQATDAVQAIRDRPLCQIVRPRESHFDIFLEKCHAVKVQGRVHKRCLSSSYCNRTQLRNG